MTVLERGFPPTEPTVPIIRGEWSKAYSFESGSAEYVVQFVQHIDDHQEDQIASTWSFV